MKLYLQCGNGFRSLAGRLAQPLRGATYILSPRDLSEPSQIEFAKQLKKSGNSILFDPQLYASRSDKPNFQSYRYWPRTCKTGDGRAVLALLDDLATLNGALCARGFILPGFKMEHIARDPADRTLRILEQTAVAAKQYGLPRYLTLCLCQNVLHDEVQVDRLVSIAEKWDIEGVYIIAEHPDSDYFVDNPFWVFQLMRLCSGFRLQGKKVILGYANHQMLCMSCTGIEAMASGNWMNTRSFTFDKFKSDTGDIKRHKLWYYAPSVLTEYSIPYLDIAYAGKVLQCLDCRKLVQDSPAAVLFDNAVRPSDVAYKQPDAFAHYLLSLNAQCVAAEADGTYLGKYKWQLETLKSAQQKLEFLQKYRMSGQNRDFAELIKVNETALNMFNFTLSMRMRMLEVEKRGDDE